MASTALAALAAAGFAAGGLFSVTLGPTGPQPTVITADYGDTLAFVNGDTVGHAITSAQTNFRADTIAPAATFTTVVTAHAGSYQYRQTGDKSYGATVVVLATGSVSLSATPATVLFGQSVLVRGRTNPNVPVLLEQRAAGSTKWQPSVTLTSGSDGSFATHLRLPQGAKFRASIDGGQVRSGTVNIGMMPLLSITASPRRTVAGRPVVVRIKLSPPRAASRVTVSSCNELDGRWVDATPRRPGANGVAFFKVRSTYGTTELRASTARKDTAAGFEPRTSVRIMVTATGTPPRAKKHPPHRC